jgi:hypothetical protein
MTHKFSLFIIALLMLSVAGCKGKKEMKRADVLFNKGKGIFRNVDFDMDLETAKKNETAPLANSAEDYLRYEITNMNGKAGEYVEIEYMFDKNRLDRMMVYYSVDSKNAADGLFIDVLGYFTKKYGGTMSNDKEWRTWQLEDKKGQRGTIEIMIKKEDRDNVFGVDIEMVKYYKDEEKPATSLLYIP